MILINTLGIQDSGGITVLNRVLKECSLDKSNSYLVACSHNENINILYNLYKDNKHLLFKFFEVKNLLRRLYVENITFRHLQKKHSIKLMYNFSGSAQFFSKTPQLIKLHNLSYFSRDVGREFFIQKKYFEWFKQIFIKRLVFATMIKQVDFLEMQSRHVQNHIQDYIDISAKRIFFKSDIDIKEKDFNRPVVMDPMAKLTLIYIVGPHFQAPHKNFNTFVRAVSKLKNEGFDFEIAVTLTKEELRRSTLWNPCLNSRTRFLGYLPKAQLMKIFVRNSMLISTSIIETLGLHVIEAVQNGVLVIVPKEKYSLDVYGPSVLTYETLSSDSLATAIRNAESFNYARVEEIVGDCKNYLIRNEKSKSLSILEIFDSVLST
ncbi:glycosyltransferase [Pseudomonadales bacterium]|nr:glycosyltransferase [Pseudomonadales bacterium]